MPYTTLELKKSQSQRIGARMVRHWRYLEALRKLENRVSPWLMDRVMNRLQSIQQQFRASLNEIEDMEEAPPLPGFPAAPITRWDFIRDARENREQRAEYWKNMTMEKRLNALKQAAE